MTTRFQEEAKEFLNAVLARNDAQGRAISPVISIEEKQHNSYEIEKNLRY